ncbi:unnamed protein product [Notodromas monacha]|uniref:SH3 domain-containing protein n=1 Tax=Notodromas monacha TaxID=399045 RepID=A0A7R9BQK4_9CRUS|nr:unnamed protein product [Notodromas monacha]CAG0918976.1 unnamed protein product [Notodromas monacha]
MCSSKLSFPACGFLVTFEDKRKENFDRGQAEIERRRKILQEQQQREIEERQRKEREEMERLERISMFKRYIVFLRLEQEAKKQAELEKQLQRQREIEEAREEERRRIQEQRETARKKETFRLRNIFNVTRALSCNREMERQRQLEWEKQRRQELLQQRQREQERVVHLKAQSQRLAAELEQMDGKIKELTDKVADTRSSVISVKGTIDGMRETRDEKIDELNKYKKLLMEHQQRMMVVVQEKAKLSERNRMNMTTAPDGNAMAATFAKKQAAINDLKAKLDEYKADEDQKLGELSTFTEELAQLKTLLTELLHNQKNLVVSYREKRVKVMDTRERVKSERLKALLDPTAAWGDDTTPIDVGPPVQDGWGEPARTYFRLFSVNNFEVMHLYISSTFFTIAAVEMPPPGTLYRALYDFERRNPDELSFYAGDITEAGSHEAGWFHGDLNGSSGWFPESYVELVTEAVVPDADIPIASAEPVLPEVDLPQEDAFIPVKDEPSAYEPPTNTFNGSAFTSEVNGSFVDGAPPAGCCVALYAYESAEPGDLNFQQGETIYLVKDEGDWWTGYLQDPNHTGVFPANYVQKVDQPVTAEEEASVTNSVPYVEPVAEADIDVAEQEPYIQQEPYVQQEPFVQQEPYIPTGPYEGATVETPPAGSGSVTPIGRAPMVPQQKGKKLEVAKVIAPYQAASAEQLNLQRGQLLQIRKKSSSGWWEGELQAKGQKKQVGWFPGTYVKILVGSRSGSAASSTRTSPLPKEMFDAPPREQFIALYSYVAQNADELSFEKGEKISIISRDEKDWWKGELKSGETGLFPANYVELLRGPDSGNCE